MSRSSAQTVARIAFDSRPASAPASRGDDHARRETFGRREEHRLDVERHGEVVAPAFEFGEAVGLALWRALGERQAARDGKHLAQIDRLDVDGRARLGGDRHKARPAQIAPGRDQRVVVIDGLGHGALPSSSAANIACIHHLL